MSNYYLKISPLTPGAYRLHKDDCPFIDDRKNLISLGSHSSAEVAFASAMLNFRTTSRCPFCTKQEEGRNNKDIYTDNYQLPKKTVKQTDVIFFAGVN